MSDSKTSPKQLVGCVGIIVATPGLLIWWVLMGMILHKTEAGTMEWALFVAYLCSHLLAFTIGAITRIAFDE